MEDKFTINNKLYELRSFISNSAPCSKCAFLERKNLSCTFPKEYAKCCSIGKGTRKGWDTREYVEIQPKARSVMCNTLEDIKNDTIGKLVSRELHFGFPSSHEGKGIFSQMEEQKVLQVTTELLEKAWRNEVAQILVETRHLEVISNHFNNLKVCRDLQLRKNVIKGILKILGYSAGSSECATLLREIADEWDD